MNESDTPRTDAALDEFAEDQRAAIHYNGKTFIDFARKLERELALMSACSKKLRDAAFSVSDESVEADILCADGFTKSYHKNSVVDLALKQAIAEFNRLKAEQ